jgi:hypothetical protein
MKITQLLIGVCLLPVLTGCHKPQAGEVIGAAEATVKTTALAAITAKHPDLSSSDLKFSDLSIRAMSKGKEEVVVSYDIPASAQTTTEGKKTTITKKTIGVAMSLSGKVESVYESTKSDTYNAAQ